MLKVEGISPELIDNISPDIEKFLSKLKSGTISGYKGQSLSTAAALEMVELLKCIIERFKEFENDEEETSSFGSPTLKMRQQHRPEVEVVSSQVQRLLHLVARTSEALIRPQFGTLLLTNVTRRVLSIIRDAAQESRVSEADLARMSSAATSPNQPMLSFPGVDSNNQLDEVDFAAARRGSRQDEDTEEGVSSTQKLPTFSSSSGCEGQDMDVMKAKEHRRRLEEKTGQEGKPASYSTPPRHPNTSSSHHHGSPSNPQNRDPRTVRFADTSLLEPAASLSVMNTTDTKVSVPGQHNIRRAPSQREIYMGSTSDLHSHLVATGGTTDAAAGAGAHIRAESPCGTADPAALPSSTGTVPLSPPPLPFGAPAHEFPVRLNDFYDNCFECLSEFSAEIEEMTKHLCNRVERQIHRGDVIITIGCTHTVRQYLLAASEKQLFRVLLLDGAPTSSLMVDKLATELEDRNVEVRRLPDSSAFAVMNTCTKVVVGAESVLANGGMLGPIGTRMLCVAARHFSVPVLVATTTLKMSPYYPSDPLCSRLVRITRARAQELPWSIYGAPELVLPLPHGVWVDATGPARHPGHLSPSNKWRERERERDLKEKEWTSNGDQYFANTPGNSPALAALTNSFRGATAPLGPAAGVSLAGHEGGRGDAGAAFSVGAVRLDRTTDGRSGTSLVMSQVAVHCASTEYVPPELVTLYATNESEFTPSQCHRVVRANYNDAD